MTAATEGELAQLQQELLDLYEVRARSRFVELARRRCARTSWRRKTARQWCSCTAVTARPSPGRRCSRSSKTGIRQGELIALPWLDVDWVARRIRVADNFPRGRTDQAETPKSHEGRSVPMADSVASELERHFQRSRFCGNSDLVFGHPQTGKPLDPSKLRKRFVEALQRAGVGQITFHELRHTFGTQLAAAGVPLRTIQEWMGHADAKTTEIYRHYSPDATHGPT
jgi:integrase